MRKHGSKIKTNQNGCQKTSNLPNCSNDSRRSRDGEYIELVGTYQPVGNASTNINEEVALKWLRNGAIPTDTVRSLFSKAGIMKKFAEEKDKKAN